MGSAWVEGGGGQETQPASLLSRVGGRGRGGEVRVTVLALHATWIHVDLSFSYLRFAEAASFDKKSSAGSAHSVLLCFRQGLSRVYYGPDHLQLVEQAQSSGKVFREHHNSK